MAATRIIPMHIQKGKTLGTFFISDHGCDQKTALQDMAPRERRGGHACKIAKWKTGGIFTF